MEEAVGGCRVQVRGVGDPRTTGSLCQIAGRPRVPAPTQAGTAVGNLVPCPVLGLHGGCGEGERVPGVPAPNRGLEGHRGGGGGAALTCDRRKGFLRRSTRRCLPGVGAPGRAVSRPAGRPCCARRPPRAAPHRRRPQPAVHARRRRQPPRTRGSRFPAQQREGGREAGAGRGRAFPASPGPSARPPAPCAAAANPEGAPGGWAPPPGAHLSLALCAAWSFSGRGASSEMLSHVLHTGKLSPGVTVSDVARTRSRQA